MQKNMLKKLGYYRNKVTGQVCDPQGEPVGTRWPPYNSAVSSAG